MTTPLPIRGVHIDCRAQMLRPERIAEILEDVAGLGYNTILFEYEDHFPFGGRLAKAAAEDALTRVQVKRLVALASELGLSVMPLVHCLGHLEYVLRVPALARLGDGPAKGRSNSTICPSDPAAKRLFREMVTQVLDLHPDAVLFHMGGDEAELHDDCPRCAPRKRELGISRLMVDLYLERAAWLRSRGVEPVMWCDMPLRHPEALEDLRDAVTIMDWDYWDTFKPRHEPFVWADNRKPVDRARPATWPKAIRELFERHVFTDDRRGRPFGYAHFFAEQGFRTLMAPAARCYGDSMVTPLPMHVENVHASAKTAAELGHGGCVMTSWSVRREPWPLTEQSVIAGGMAMSDPGVTRRAIDLRFTREHFGVADVKLAKIPALLGLTVDGCFESLPVFDAKTGRWPGQPYGDRLKARKWHEDPAKRKVFVKQLRQVRRAVAQAEPLLAKAKPKTRRQKERVAFWGWGLDMHRHYADFAELTLQAPGRHDRKALKRFLAQATKLAGRTEKLLGRWYTDHTMLDEMQTRFGIQRAFVEGLLRGSNKTSAPFG